MTGENESIGLEKRVDRMDKRLEDTLRIMTDMYADIKIIKNTCKSRGETCGTHFKNIEKKVTRLEDDIDGDADRDGLKTKVSHLQSQDLSKEKYLYLVIGALISGGFSLIFVIISHLLK